MSALAIIETTGTQTEVDLIATEAIRFDTHASQGGRLGLELAIPAAHAKAVNQALRDAGHTTIVTVRK